jgi:hypothetical protein
VEHITAYQKKTSDKVFKLRAGYILEANRSGPPGDYMTILIINQIDFEPAIGQADPKNIIKKIYHTHNNIGIQTLMYVRALIRWRGQFF